MYGKIILSFAFMAFVTVQLAQGKDTEQKQLQCYSCESVQSCKNPMKVICNQGSANNTREHLQKYFPYMTNNTSTDYECLRTSLSEKKNLNSTVASIRGCMYLGAFNCHSNPLNGSLTISKDCNSCTKNLCNPAGTFSSSFAIMISAIFGLILAKIFAM